MDDRLEEKLLYGVDVDIEKNMIVVIINDGFVVVWIWICDFVYKVIVFGWVELRGVVLIFVKERMVDRMINIFMLWWFMNVNILLWVFFVIWYNNKKLIREWINSIVFGMIGFVFGFSFRDSFFVILFFVLLIIFLLVYFVILGLKIGMR